MYSQTFFFLSLSHGSLNVVHSFHRTLHFFSLSFFYRAEIDFYNFHLFYYALESAQIGVKATFIGHYFSKLNVQLLSPEFMEL